MLVVQLHPPPFWHRNPQPWFQEIEAQFSFHRVFSEATRYDHLLSYTHSNPTGAAPYQHLKEKVLERFPLSERTRLRQFSATKGTSATSTLETAVSDAIATRVVLRLHSLNIASGALPTVPFPGHPPSLCGGRSH
ncbi:hypothetical protein HPB50_024830 [Hyalomma asiaticum]|uniref:Uncharacterized protein n=1 Tax=Hyalomma asiaticum TaxID=266040 RepID=A0ACB7TBX9_HYAAI|nr:hypothetical protein HPB50_024830 [Hyalomma asiaticum]